MIVAVVVATHGRPEIIGRFVRELMKQTCLPDHLVLSICLSSDLPTEILQGTMDLPYPVSIVLGVPGLTIQRNRGIAFLEENMELVFKSGVLIFLDDDFFMASDWIELLKQEMERCPHVVGYTGLVLADGAALEGYTLDTATRILSSRRPLLSTSDWRMRSGDAESLYGCNMAVRGTAIGDLRFDETLVLYAWLEDFDFSVRLAHRGLLRRSPLLAGVHLGWKGGRSSGTRVGYAQIANPIYLYQKGTMPLRVTAKYAFKNFCANVLKSFRPEPFMDRRGRLLGNLLALRDLLLNRISPGNIAEL